MTVDSPLSFAENSFDKNVYWEIVPVGDSIAIQNCCKKISHMRRLTTIKRKSLDLHVSVVKHAFNIVR